MDCALEFFNCWYDTGCPLWLDACDARVRKEPVGGRVDQLVLLLRIVEHLGSKFAVADMDIEMVARMSLCHTAHDGPIRL